MRWNEEQGYDVELIGNMVAHVDGSSTPVTARGIAITVRVVAESEALSMALAKAHAVEHGLKEIKTVAVIRGPFAVIKGIPD
ncbi:MAG: hypothetical protein V3W28_06075 [Thermoplasmata archaeon]